jgi:predicted RNase H-like HicB family nuclease
MWFVPSEVSGVYTVKAEWDEEARVWIASSEDVPGLVTGADTFEELAEKLRGLLPEMLEANGVLPAGEAAQVRFRIVAERAEHARAVA